MRVGEPDMLGSDWKSQGALPTLQWTSANKRAPLSNSHIFFFFLSLWKEWSCSRPIAIKRSQTFLIIRSTFQGTISAQFMSSKILCLMPRFFYLCVFYLFFKVKMKIYILGGSENFSFDFLKFHSLIFFYLMKKYLPHLTFFEIWTHVILYHKSNLVYTVVFPEFLIFQQ